MEPPTQNVFEPGAQLGPYRIEAAIGAGAMGQVYRALDTRLHRLVAIKVLPRDKIADEDRKRRFLQEARAASALNHPNIVTLHDISNDRGIDFLVLEYVRGKTLKEMIPPGGLAPGDLIEYGVQIASALAAAHAAGIIHRDIKPANIMITPEKQVKVLDFGLAKLTPAVGPEEATRTTAEGTTPGVLLGTVAYMSPEQTRGEALDGRSDIFSLGSVLYHAATGRLPFQGPSTLAIMHEIAAGTPAATSTVRSDLPRELDSVIEHALAKDKQQRYGSAAELVQDLQAMRTQSSTGVSTASRQAVAARPRLGRRVELAAVLLVLAAAAGIAYYTTRHGSQIDSIAVLPFVNASKDANLDYQVDGLTDELINGLTQVPDLKVKGRSTAFSYKGRELDPQAIGKQLDVRAVLTGTVKRDSDRISVQADLLDTKDGSQLWGKRYDRTLAELQAIPDDIVQQVTGKIRSNPADQKRAGKRRAANPQAYELYLKGRHAVSEMTPDRIRQSKVFFQQAIALDPNYASAYAGLADSYSYLAIFEMADPRDVLPKAREAALAALERDSEAAEVYTSLGVIQLSEWDWAGAGKRFLKAIELNPGGAFDQHFYGHYLESIGDWHGAQNRMEKALALDPLSPIYGEDLAYDLMMNRHYDEAIEKLRRVIGLDPEDTIAHAFLAVALEGKGLRAESLAEADRARPSAVGTFVVGTVGAIFCRLGKPDEARKLLAELQNAAKTQYVCPLQPGMIHIALGETEEGFRLLDKAVQERSVNLQNAGSDATFDSVRRDPRFTALRQKLGLPEAAWATSVMGK